MEGRSTINQALLTGESRPVEKGEGDQVIGGSINGESAVTLEVRKTGAETSLAQVVELARKAQESRSRSQDLADRARMVTVVVIACPHPLGLAVPLVLAVSTALSATHGLLLRDRSAFERSRDLDAIVFDKTGTLTEGRFGVADVVPLGGLTAGELLRLAASVESRSEYPIAAGVLRGAEERGLTWPRPGSSAPFRVRGRRGWSGSARCRS